MALCARSPAINMRALSSPNALMTAIAGPIDSSADPAPVLSRRGFVVGAAAMAGGLALGLHAEAAASAPGPQAAGAAIADGAAALTDWVRIGRDDSVTVIVSQAEMGQGISTTLPALLCDELGADWPRLRLELAPTGLPYRNPRVQWQFTGNSESMQAFAALMRTMGATGRAMLIAAAARRWQVPAAECDTRAGRVVHRPSGRSLRFGDVAQAAALEPQPIDPPLRPAGSGALAGLSVPRVDIPQKVDGSASFGIDDLPDGLSGVVFAAMRSAPAYGARLLALRNRAALMALPGVIDVVLLPGAVAVVAHKYWQASAALAVAELDVEPGPHAAMSSASLRALYWQKLADGPVKVAAEHAPDGPPPAVRHRHEAVYELPFQAHATLEPMNALAHVTATRVDIWAPTQGQELAKYAVAGALQRDPEDVRVFRSPFLGGGFGRRLLPDFCIDAALLSRAVGRPVKLIWSREEDLRRDWFRPATLHRLQAELDGAGRPLRITQRLVSPTILKPVFPTLDLAAGLDPSALEGTLETRYRIPGWRTEFHLLDIPVPTSVYRTTGWGPSIFGLESFIDELAQRAGQDPYRYRRALLAHDARGLRVLDEVARRAGWQRALPRGRGRGIAFTDAFGTVLAQVVEVTVTGHEVRVDRVVTVADLGTVYDARIAEACIEGGVIWGLSSAVKHEITFADGGPVQTNFHAYDLLRLHETPRIETHLLQTPGAPVGGIGEVGPVATVPALANAIFSATGRRLRSLPLARSGLQLA
jgi:isoquinoline 1-oxidoreductase beta subunit